MDTQFDYANEVYFLKEAIELEIAYQNVFGDIAEFLNVFDAAGRGDLDLRDYLGTHPEEFHKLCKDKLKWSPVSDDHLYRGDLDQEIRDQLAAQDLDEEYERRLDEDRWFLGDWRDYL